MRGVATKERSVAESPIPTLSPPMVVVNGFLAGAG